MGHALVLAASLFASSAVAQETGTWLRADGVYETRVCLSRAEYGETTPLPEGCPALVVGGGILYTRASDLAVAADLTKQKTLLAAQLGVIESLQAKLTDTVAAHQRIAAEMNTDMTKCTKALEAAPSKTSVWLSLAGGVALGAVLVSALAVSL